LDEFPDRKRGLNLPKKKPEDFHLLRNGEKWGYSLRFKMKGLMR